MSVLIKGMKMPKKCLWCPLQYIGFCQVTKTDVNSDLGRRADDCPLVELPEKHGRLIDAEVAKEALMHEMCGTGYQSNAMRTVESEIFTPTIFEAEGEG